MRLPLKHILLALFLLILAGCASPQQRAWDHYERGMLLVFNGYDASQDKTDKVVNNYQKALEYNPLIPGVNASLGTYLAKQGDNASATKYFEQEVKMHPDAGEALIQILDPKKIRTADEDKKKAEEAKKEKAKKKEEEKKAAASPSPSASPSPGPSVSPSASPSPSPAPEEKNA